MEVAGWLGAASDSHHPASLLAQLHEPILHAHTVMVINTNSHKNIFQYTLYIHIHPHAHTHVYIRTYMHWCKVRMLRGTQVGRWISSSWPSSVPAQMHEPQAATDVIVKPAAKRGNTHCMMTATKAHPLDRRCVK